MCDSIQYARSLTETLNAWNNTGSGKLAIPSQLDLTVSALVTRFIEASIDIRATIQSVFTDDHSDTFITFAERMATYAVRTKSKEPIIEGLAALVLEGGKFDVREDMMVMAPLYDAALKIGADPCQLFEQAAKLLETPVSHYILEFPNRSPADRSLKAFFYVEAANQDGFVYERTSWF